MTTFKNLRGFTIIELLVVISIIGVLSSLSVVSLGRARVGARTTKVKSDVTSLGTAVESFRAATDNIVSNVPGAGADTLTSTGGGTLGTIFNGNEDATLLTYGARATNPPRNYSLNYLVLSTPTTGLRQLVDGNNPYTLYTQLVEADNSYFTTTQTGITSTNVNPAGIPVEVAGSINCPYNGIVYTCTTLLSGTGFASTTTGEVTFTPTAGGAPVTINFSSIGLATGTLQPGDYNVSVNITSSGAFSTAFYIPTQPYSGSLGFAYYNNGGPNAVTLLSNPVTVPSSGTFRLGVHCSNLGDC